MRFSTCFFLHKLSLPGPLSNGLKYFWFWLIEVFPQYEYHIAQSPSTRIIILRWVRLPAVSLSYCEESISLQYHIAGSHSWPQPFLKTFTQTFKGTVSPKKMCFLILLKSATFCIFTKQFLDQILFLLPTVWYFGESVFSTLNSITQWDLLKIRNFFSPVVSGPNRFQLWKKLEVDNIVGLSL